jgi:hypothetical protein
MTTDSPRIAKLRLLVKQHSSVAAFARAYDIDVTYVRQLLGGHRNLGEKAARKLGEKIAHDPALFEDYTLNPLTADEAALLANYRQLDAASRDEVSMFAQLKAKSDTLRKTNGPPGELANPKSSRAA